MIAFAVPKHLTWSEERAKRLGEIKEEAKEVRGEAQGLIENFQTSRKELKSEINEASATWQGLTSAKSKNKKEVSMSKSRLEKVKTLESSINIEKNPDFNVSILTAPDFEIEDDSLKTELLKWVIGQIKNSHEVRRELKIGDNFPLGLSIKIDKNGIEIIDVKKTWDEVERLNEKFEGRRKSKDEQLNS